MKALMQIVVCLEVARGYELGHEAIIAARSTCDGSILKGRDIEYFALKLSPPQYRSSPNINNSEFSTNKISYGNKSWPIPNHIAE